MTTDPMRCSLLGLATALLLLAGCGAPPDGTTEERPTTLVYCSEGSPESFNPQIATAGTTFDASSRQIYERLVAFRIGSTETIPGLAKRWEISDDGRVYRFFLRRNVAFHDTEFFTPTRPFNADDVLFSFNRMADPDHPYHSVSNGIYKYYQDMDLGNLVEALVRIDDYTIEFRLSEPYAPFLSTMAMDFASILSAEYGEQLMAAGSPEQIDQRPIGTGPYQFLRYQKDAQIVYEAHPAYWRGREAIDRLIFAITVDPSVRYARLKRGECHVMGFPLPSDIAAMQADPNITVDEQAGLNIGYWAFNTEKPPFDNRTVRLAMNHAINREAILEAVYQGTGERAKNPIPPTIWSYDAGIEPIAYNPERARRLLREAGYGEGFETNIWAMPVQRPYNPNARKVAEMIQADLDAIGVEARIQSYEWGTYLARSRRGDHDTILLGWTGDNGDPDNFFGNLLSCAAARSGANRARWCDAEFDRLIREARGLSERSARAQLYRKAQRRFKAELPWLTIAHSVRYQPARSEVRGLKIDPFGGIYFSGVSLDPDA